MTDASEKKNAGKTIFIILTALVMFAAGGAAAYFTGGAKTAKSEETPVKLQIYDGYIEYFDGAKWVRLKDVKTAEAQDPFSSAQTQRDADEVKSDTPSRSGGTVVVARPRTTTTTTTTTSTPSAPSGGGSSTPTPPTPAVGDGEDITVGD